MKHVLETLFAVFLFCLVSFSQERIDVKSVTMSNDGYDSGITMRTTNSGGLGFVYGTSNSNVVGRLGLGFRIPSVTSTDRFHYLNLGTERVIYASLSIADDSGIRFVLSGDTISDDVVFTPRVKRRGPIEMKGRTQLFISRIEILGTTGNVVAVDNDVALSGKYVAKFDKISWSLFEFKRIDFTFIDPRN
jgi:hypothetical protein